MLQESHFLGFFGMPLVNRTITALNRTHLDLTWRASRISRPHRTNRGDSSRLRQIKEIRSAHAPAQISSRAQYLEGSKNDCWKYERPDSGWFARMRRAVADLWRQKTNHSPDRIRPAERKPLSIGEQIYVQFQLERLDRCGFYQQPRGHRNTEPLDELMGPPVEDDKSSKD
jgi:hypothetical protein